MRGRVPVVTARLLVADDHEVVRRGVCGLLQEQPGWVIVAEVGDGRQAVAKAGELRPDVAILDVGMPSLNGLEAARQIAKVSETTKLLILTAYSSDEIVRTIVSIGAHGYVLKADAGHALINGVRALLANRRFFSPSVATPAKGDGDNYGAPWNSLMELTAREREIVQLLAEGKSSKEAADLLKLSVKTIDTHQSNIFRKLNCRSVTELVRYAIRNHLVEV